MNKLDIKRLKTVDSTCPRCGETYRVLAPSSFDPEKDRDHIICIKCIKKDPELFKKFFPWRTT